MISLTCIGYLMAFGLTLANPLPGPYPSEREVFPDLCAGAVNCEQFLHNVTGYHSIRFKAGMGPGSPWYANNVASHDDLEGLLAARASRDGDVTSNVDRSSAEIKYGDKVPSEMLNDQLTQHCYQSSCQGTWNVPVTFVPQPGPGTGTGNVQITAEGSYPANKDYYVSAIVEIAKKLQENHDEQYLNCVPVSGGPPFCQTYTMTIWNSGRYFSMTRFITAGGNKAISGFLHVNTAFEQTSNPQGCDSVIAALTAIMSATGPIGAIGGGFFGQLGSALCQG